jgi:thiamine-phosphate pyrophosphorylase
VLPKVVVVADVDAADGEEGWLRVLHRLGQLPPGLPVAVQVRAKGRRPGELERLARRAQDALVGRVPVVLNGPAAVARALELAGVHWPESEIPQQVPEEARGLVRSASVHSPQAARRAEPVVHYLVFGPVFTPGSKAAPAAGLGALRQTCAAVSCPVLAIGGVTPERVADCLSCGATGVAVVSAVVRAPDPAAATVRLVEALQARP